MLVVYQVKKMNLNHKKSNSLCGFIAYNEWRITNGGTHSRGLEPEQHSSKETSWRWRAVDDTLSDLTETRIKPHISRADSDVYNRYTNQPTDTSSKSRSWKAKIRKFASSAEDRGKCKFFSNYAISAKLTSECKEIRNVC